MINRHLHHQFPQTRTYHFMDGTMRKLEKVDYVEASTWEHIWVAEDSIEKIFIINPADVKYTVVEHTEEITKIIKDFVIWANAGI